MDRDFEKIKELFDGDGIKAPDSLSEESIFAMLPDHEVPAAEPDINEPFDPAEEAFRYTESVVSPDLSRRSKLHRYVAIAACLIVALIGAPSVYRSFSGAPDTAVVNGELYTFKDHAEIRQLVASIDDDYSSGSGGILKSGRIYETGDIIEDEVSNEISVEDAPEVVDLADEATPLAGSPDSDTSNHSDTYLQVEEVDEADIVKTDGKYIYFVSNTSEVVILSADNGKTSKVASIGTDDIENYINDIYLKGSILVTVGTVYDSDSEEGYSAVVTYDISDPSAPERISDFRQSGNIVSSRMVGNYVYLVTSDYIYNKSRIIPECTASGKLTELPATDISCVPDPVSKSYIVLSAIDIASGETALTRSKAIFGASDTVYCNDHNLYAAVDEWNQSESGVFTTSTRIVRASIDGLDIKFDATAKVRGRVYGQFAMNEKDGFFYIATTSERAGMDVNNLFVLDNNLDEAGTLSGFARNESIKAVRFIGDKAYVITYEAIDPLFVIDTSDPASPSIDGEVKIDGFSSLLVPVGDDKLIGIGYATGDNGYGGEYASGLKLALFDVSDPSDPEVTDSMEFEDMDSPAQYTHLALTVNSRDGWMAIPYSVYHSYDTDEVIDYDEESDGEELELLTDGNEDIDTGWESGVLMFEADDSIEVIDQHRLTDESLLRNVYIGSYMYALTYEGEAFSFKFK